jgi:hypothetical protein
MEKQVSLSVPKPCAESWSSFTSTDSGAFCASCSKVVVDFTQMSENEVIDFTGQKTNTVCGRFRTTQLKTYSVPDLTSIRPSWGLLKASLLIMLFLMVSKPSISHALTGKSSPELAIYPQQQNEHGFYLKDYSIKGVVKSEEDNAPIPGVNIYLKGSAIGTVSDESGQFEFPQKLKEGDVLVFSFIGLETKEFIITNTTQERVEISLALSAAIMMGEVVVGQIYTVKQPTTAQKWWSKVKSVF